MKRALILTIAVGVVAASGATAQGFDRDGPPGRRSRGPAFLNWSRGGLQRFDPGFLLQRQSELSLTDTQVEQLTRLNTEAVTVREQARIAFVSQRAQLAEALASPEPDRRAARAQFDSAQAAMSNLQWTGIRTALEARNVLTEEQQFAVRDLRARAARDRPPRSPRRRR